MSWLRAIPFLFTLLAFVLQPASASAFGPAHPEARVSAFELVALASVGASAETSPGLHEGIGRAYDENASGYRFAARGASQVAGQGFRSFSAAKRALGPAGPGKQWHHIVEQGGNVERFRAEAIHNTSNLVRVDTAVHRQISGFYSSKQPFTGGQTVRQWLRSQSFDEQMQFGLDTLRRFGGGQ